MPDHARRVSPASFVEGLARRTGIFDPSSIVDPWVGPGSGGGWDIAAYGPDRKLISVTTASDTGQLAEPLHVPAGGYVWVRSDLRRETLPVFVSRACTITQIEQSGAVAPPSDPALAEYKGMLVRMIREKADHWERVAAAMRDEDPYATLAYVVGAYRDVASLIEFGEVVW